MKTILSTVLVTAFLATTTLAPLSARAASGDVSRSDANQLESGMAAQLAIVRDAGSTPAQRDLALAWIAAHRAEATSDAASLDAQAKRANLIGGAAAVAGFASWVGMFFAPPLMFATGACSVVALAQLGVRDADSSAAQALRTDLSDADTLGSNVSRNASVPRGAATSVSAAGANTGFHH